MYDDIFFVIIITSLAIHIQLLNAINTVLHNSSPFPEPWVTAAAHTLLCSNVMLTKKWIFKGRGLVRGHTVDFIIRGGYVYPCTNDNSSQCVRLSVCVCVGGGGGVLK